MWKKETAAYGKEPFDLRLTVLLMLQKWYIIVGVTLLGMVLFGGSYYLKNIVFRGVTVYETTSTYRVTYVEEPSKSGDYYINEMTWNTYVDSKEFLDAVYAHLQENTIWWDSQFVSSSDELADMVDAELASDVHIPSTVVTTTSDIWTLLIAQAVESAMVQEFAEYNEQVAAIDVMSPASQTAEVMPDVRPLRAFGLSGILSFFFAVVFLLLQEISEESIWLPATMRKRYGLRVLGTINSPEFSANLEFMFAACKKIGVCALEESVNPGEVIEVLREKWVKEWISVPAPILCPEGASAMRELDGVLLVVKAGANAGKTLEYILEYLYAQEIEVTAVLLWDADERLIRRYYGKVLDVMIK